MPEHFDPFKAAVAERFTRHQQLLEGLHAQTEKIRERVYRPEKHLVPKLNTLYDSQRTPNAWRYTADLSIPLLGIALVAGINTVPIATPVSQPPNWRLEQWPNAVSLYYVVTEFGFAQRAVVATPGTLLIQFLPTGGPAVCIGMTVSSLTGTNLDSFDSGGDILIPFPVSDPGNPAIGNLLITLSPGSTGFTADMFINIAVAYLLPSAYGYELREDVPTPVERVHENGHIIVEGSYTREREDKRRA